MKLACETILREARNDKVIVQERTANGKVYCTTHINFETSTPIHDTFENVCRRYDLDLSMSELLKQADSRSAAQDAINNREDSEKLNTFEKEIKPMNETTYINEDYIIKDKITSTIMNTVCSIAINFNRLPVDLGFKLNNLNETEFKLYAKQLFRHVLDNATPFYEYPDKQAHDKAFYSFRDKNKHLVDDSRTVPAPASKPEYHIPTDTDIKFKNDAELLALAMQTIEELSKRILTAREAVKNDAELVDTIISQLPKPRKTSAKK